MRVLAPALLGGLLLVAVLALAGLPWSSGAPQRAAAASAAGEVSAQTDASVPASQVTLIGATPKEPGAPGANEVWGAGQLGGEAVIVRYHRDQGEEGSWALERTLPAGFKPPAGEPLAGSLTARGTIVLAGEIGSAQGVLVRAPGGAFEQAPIPSSEEAEAHGEEPLLEAGDELYGAGRAPLMAAIEGAEGQAEALLVPVQKEGKGSEEAVLHWSGSKWEREQIEVPEASRSEFRVLAIAAGSPTDAWLLGQLSSEGEVALFRRVRAEAGGWSWKPVAIRGAPAEEPYTLSVPLREGEPAPFTVAGHGTTVTASGQLLTVAEGAEGVWVDGEREGLETRERPSVTMYLSATGGEAEVSSSWCWPAGATGATPCQHELPEALPSGRMTYRSFAWAGAGLGERVITGGPEGLSLRLEGESFKRVLALGAGKTAGERPGAEFGAAFVSPAEGWLGESSLPVHLTEEPIASKLAIWPSPFRHPLLAIAPEPGAPEGSLSSEALAVGVDGEVARFRPGEGWQPESLFGPGERVERNVQLRAVAWPTPTRAFAVGDEGQMWLWRAETGLWESDPATPRNFRGDLLGVAFDPGDTSLGYAVGTTEVGLGGVLLRYGKTWTEETDLPPQVQGAAFTSIAFAGSEAIVAYRRQSDQESKFEGGLLVNDGSGWHVDEQAAQVTGEGVPVAVAGLPDGGAAFATVGGGVGRVFERESESSPWRETPQPLPRGAGQLALFREGGAVRAIVAVGSAVGSLAVEQPPPAGLPPDYYPPSGITGTGALSGEIMRQTATGWSDQEHELRPAGNPEGSYIYYDMPYRPDPIRAVLVNASGTQGWAVGGYSGSEEPLLDTGDVERYPAEGGEATGQSTAAVPLQTESERGEAEKKQVRAPEPLPVTFAVGGDAQCAAPCVARVQAKPGPQVWLTEALALAHRIAGVHSFLYTGPSVTEGAVNGIRSLPVPFGEEFERERSIFQASGMNVYVAPSLPDRNARPESEGNLSTFEQAFAGLPAPFGESEEAYYSFSEVALEGDARVRVIVIDDSGEVDETQLKWLKEQLESAADDAEPAVVIGSESLKAQLASHENERVAEALVYGANGLLDGRQADAASAYFYDSPEENVQEPLQLGSFSIPTFGSGTLGYEAVQKEASAGFHGASGILLAQVQTGAEKRNPTSNIAPVRARLIPVIGELAIEAKQGTLLRRSQPVRFEALARRPRAGSRASEASIEPEVDPYIPIPSECVGRECPVGVFPEYSFTSSDPSVGAFVEHNTEAANDPLAVLQNERGEPIDDETDEGVVTPAEPREFGLFCPYNKGETTITVSAGGLKASLRVVVQAGSVREPCGTVPAKSRPPAQQLASPSPPPAPAPAPVSPAPASSPPPLSLPPPPAPPPPVRQTPAKTPTPTPFIPLVVPSTPLLAFVPPPVPTPARPNPPTGTSAVTSPVEAVEKEEEEESATEQASNLAVAYRSDEHDPLPEYLIGLIVLAALAGASTVRTRRGRRGVRFARAGADGGAARRGERRATRHRP
ncbi:MAG TPA: hypothetical protein VL979_10085 [Solirubrobacteraceae bacterium]|nr:hypothetical protein [Solirubrobacteraceae bacterium]